MESERMGAKHMICIYLTLIDTEEDKKRFVVFYEQYRGLMLYIARQILDDAHLSEDAVQEAFLRIAKNFHKINEVTSSQARAFAVIVTRNVAFDLFNAEKKIIDTEVAIVRESQETFSSNLFETVSYKLLTDYILELPEKYRDVLYLNLVYGYTFKETANLLEITASTAKKRAERARNMLKEKIRNGD